MATKKKHQSRSARSSHDRKEGMRYMDWCSTLKTEKNRRLQNLRKGKDKKDE